MPGPTPREQPPVHRAARSRKPVAAGRRAPERRQSQPGLVKRAFTVPKVRELTAPAVEEMTDDTW